MSGQIFISYRREDSSAWTGRLYDRLHDRFPQHEIFMDVDNLPPGIDFVEALEKSVGACDVQLVVIGKRWLMARDEKRRRRLSNPEDFVRLEIATALKRGIGVIPVLVDGASMPRSADLPEDLKALVRRQAVAVSHDRFRADAERLIDAVGRALGGAQAELQRKGDREGKERLQVEQGEKERVEAQRRGREGKERLGLEHRRVLEPETAEPAAAEAPPVTERPPVAGQNEGQVLKGTESDSRAPPSLADDAESPASLLKADQTPWKKVLANLKKRWRLLLAVGSGVAILWLSFEPLKLPLLEAVASVGNNHAKYRLGLLYMSSRDYAKASKWYQKAADDGNAYAMERLGYMYQNGLGVAQDYAQARRWYQKAADAGDSWAKEALSRLPSE
jgi:hypothetical protein